MNLEIDTIGLESTIKLLENDNKDFIDILENINTTLKQLDESKWDSEEKRKIDEVLLPYINRTITDVKKELNSPILVLKVALFKYQEENNLLGSEVEKLES